MGSYIIVRLQWITLQVRSESVSPFYSLCSFLNLGQTHFSLHLA
jgi:hypothetical protein